MHDQQRKIRAALLPPFVMDTTLPNLGHGNLRAIVQGKEFRTARGLVSYNLETRIRAEDDIVVSRAAAVFAKELVLSGLQVLWVPLAAALREVRLHGYNDETPPTVPLMQSLGASYIVIPDWRGIDQSATGAELQAVLGAHIAQGGGIILAPAVWQEDVPTKLTASFRALAENFITVSI